MGICYSRMSLLPNQTNINLNEFFFLRGSGQVLNVSTLNATNISTGTLTASLVSTTNLYASTISTLGVDLDGQLLTANAQDLLLNGVPIATTSNISSLADWSLDPAISTIQMQGNNIYQAGQISTTSIIGGNAFFGNLMALNSMFLSTYTSTISSVVNIADEGFYSTLSTGSLIGGDASPSTLWGKNSTFYLEPPSSFATENITCSTLTAANSISTPALYVSSINGAEFNQNSVVVSSLITASISTQLTLMSSLQFNPGFSLGGVNLGLGSLFGNLGGAALGGLGVLVGGAALGTGIAALTQGRQTNNLNSNVYELVNGTTQLQISTLGSATSTIYRFVNSAQPDAIPGEEVFVSTINPAGAVCIRSLSDPLNTISTPNSTIQSFGQWVRMPDIPIISTTSSFTQLFTSSIGASTLSFPNDTLFRAGSSFGGTGGVSTLELYWAGSVPPLDATLRVGDLIISGSDVAGLNYSKDVIIQNLNNGQRLGVYAAGVPGVSTIAFLSDLPQPVSTFRTFGVSSLTGSTISAISGNFNNLAGYTSAPINVTSGLDATGQLIVSDESRTNNLAVSTIQNQGPAASQIAFSGTALTLNAPQLVVNAPIPSATISTATISSLNGGIPYTTLFPPSQVDSFSTIKVSTIKDLNSSILIQNADLANVSLNTAGDIIGVATNYINWQVSAGANIAGCLLNVGGAFGGSWSNGANGPGYLAASTINVSTNQMAVKNISTNAVSGTLYQILGPSTIQLSTTTAAGTASQPAGRLIVSGNDLDLGQQDLWCQQVRVGAGNPSGSAQTEVIWYSPDNLTTRGLGLGGSDLTLRVQSTINSGTNNGYMLDTTLNPPIFSTINGQVNLMASYPSTSLGVFGVSTISKMNPVSLYGNSTLAGGAVTIVFSPPYADSNEYSVLLTYKDTAGGAPLHANILSVSSFSANGSATNNFFWQTIGRV